MLRRGSQIEGSSERLTGGVVDWWSCSDFRNTSDRVTLICLCHLELFALEVIILPIGT